MAAGIFKVYAKAKGALGSGSIDLTGSTFRIAFAKSFAFISTNATASTKASMITDGAVFHASVGSYSASGRLLASPTWTSVAAGVWGFDATDFSISVTSGTLSALKAMVIFDGARPLCWASFSARQAVPP